MRASVPASTAGRRQFKVMCLIASHFSPARHDEQRALAMLRDSVSSTFAGPAACKIGLDYRESPQNRSFEQLDIAGLNNRRIDCQTPSFMELAGLHVLVASSARSGRFLNGVLEGNRQGTSSAKTSDRRGLLTKPPKH